MYADELRIRLSRVLRNAYPGRRHAAARILLTPLLVLGLVGIQPQAVTTEARSDGQASGVLLAATTTSTAQLTCGRASLRTGPAPSYPIAGTADAGVFVTVVAAQPGANYNTKCSGGNRKGSTWYQITAVNGTSTSALYGVTAVYAPAALFTPVSSPTPSPTASAAAAPTATPTPIATLTAVPSSTSSPSSTAAPIATPTATLTPSSPAATPALTAAPTVAATLPPSPTPAPTLPPTPAPTPAPTLPPTPAPTPAPTRTPSATATASPAPTYSFDEEFNGTSLSSAWRHDYSCCGNVTMDHSLSAVPGDGYLHQKVVNRNGAWYADLIDSGYAQTYGTFSARIRVTSKVSGLWPAFWLYSGTFGTDGDEIDAVELLGSEGMVAAHQTVHKGTQTNQVGASWSAINHFGDATQWHVYSVAWRPTYIAFSIDGVETWRESSMLISTSKRILLNMGMGGWGGTPSLSGSGAEMLVDWVRVTP